MKIYDIKKTNDKALYSITLMMIGCAIGFILFLFLMLFKLYVPGIVVQLVLVFAGLLIGLGLDIKLGLFKKQNS